MNHMTSTFVATLCTALVCPCTFDVCAADPPAFKSELFKTGTLVYSDDFDGEINRERWGAPTRDKQIADGKLIVSATVGDEQWKKNVAKSKFSDDEKFGENAYGKIMLTDHNSEVWYRNLKLQPLTPPRVEKKE